MTGFEVTILVATVSVVCSVFTAVIAYSTGWDKASLDVARGQRDEEKNRDPRIGEMVYYVREGIGVVSVHSGIVEHVLFNARETGVEKSYILRDGMNQVTVAECAAFRDSDAAVDDAEDRAQEQVDKLGEEA